MVKRYVAGLVALLGSSVYGQEVGLYITENRVYAIQNPELFYEAPAQSPKYITAPSPGTLGALGILLLSMGFRKRYTEEKR